VIVRAIPLDFHRAPGYAMPTDRELHRQAVQWAEKNLSSEPNFSEYQKIWLACEMEDEKVKEIHGALGFTMRPDLTLARFLNRQAFASLYHRASAFFADNGARGNDVLLYVSSTEAPEQKCPQQLESLAAVGARPADRWLIKIR
jgi:hypothetical protein